MGLHGFVQDYTSTVRQCGHWSIMRELGLWSWSDPASRHATVLKFKNQSDF